MAYKFNVFTGRFDITEDPDKYVKKTGDTMTGDLTLPTLYATSSGVSQFFGGIETTYLQASNTGFSVFNGGIIIKSGQKLIFDGA